MKLTTHGQPDTAPAGVSILRSQIPPLALLIFAMVLWTFWPAVHNDFVGYDDPDYVTGNGHVQQGLTWKNLTWAFSTSTAGNWHPLTWLSHMLDCQLFGLSPSEHHFTSILLHALNAALLFILLHSLTGAKWRSLIVAGLFGLHPLRVESVAWIAERKDVLSTFFFLLVLLAYVRYVSEKSKVDSAQKSSFLLCLILFALGLLSKPMLVTVPFVLLLLDFWPLRRQIVQDPKSKVQSPKIEEPRSAEHLNAKIESSTFRNLLIEKIPFFVLAAIFSVITVVVQRKGGAMSLTIPFIDRVENAVISYCRYLEKTFYPAKLAFFYPYDSHWPATTLAVALLVLIGITVLAILLRRTHSYVLTGWLWFVGTLVPVIGLVQVGEQALADRYTYIPSIGLFLALVWFIHDLTRAWKFQAHFFGVLAGVIGLVYIFMSREQIKVWKNNDTLFAHAIAVTKNNYIAHNNLGATYEREGRLDDAAAQFRQAISEKPDHARAHKNLAVVLERKGDSTNALEEYRAAIRSNPNLAEAHNALGAFFNSHGRLDESVEELRQALKLKPDYADAHFNLGVDYGRKGMIDAAIREYQAVLELEPNRAEAHNNLGVAFASQGQVDNAIQQYVQAILLDPRYARARFNLGVALSQKGAIAPAIEQFQEVLKLKPDYAEARTNLETLLEMREKR